MDIAPLLFFGTITALLAYRKGYNPLCWFFAAGVVGLVVLAFRPFVNRGNLSETERAVLLRRGNRIGLIITGIGFALALFLRLTL